MRAACAIVGVILAASSAVPAQTLEIVNYQTFDIRMPVTLRGVKLDAGVGATHRAQPAGDDLVVMVDAPASQTRKVQLAERHAQQADANAVSVKPDRDSLAISAGGKDMGRLSWSVVVGPGVQRKGNENVPPSTKRDFAATFKPAALKFEPAGDGPLFADWKATGTASGLKLDVLVRAYNTGFLDTHVTVTNESAPRKDVYAAVVCRWEQPDVASQTLCYDNRRQELTDGGYSPFREGEGRHLYIQRGVDWINTRLADGGAGVVWFYDFTPSFTYHRDASESKSRSTGEIIKHPPRWVGANSAHLGQEAQAKDGSLYSVTEIARPNLRQYEARIEDNILPGPDQPLTITSRLQFDSKAVGDDAADDRFVGYAGFNPQQVTTVGGRVQFGAAFARVGTNYFPYSTLGENFGELRMEGMSKEGYWPLAPQTVIQWQKFADDIRRDLRILKAMGFELCRLHHLEVLWDKDREGKELVPEAKRWEYLDFFFGELEKLNLKALLDVKLPPKDVAELVRRYGRLCDGVEYDNEVLIFQIADEDIPLWKDVYAAVKQADPDMPFHLTAHTNMGAFDRIFKEGVKVDRIGQHAYLDGVEPIPSSRDYALAAGNYAAKQGLEAQITEWNWRFLTRMPMEERAKIYAPIFENVFAARSVPTVYQFQYQDSLAMNPTTLKGIRRYEQLLLSRRPKPEALVMMELIEKYGPPDSGVRRIGIERREVDLVGVDGATVEFEVVNKTQQPMPVVMSAEGPAGVKLALGGRSEAVLEPRKPLKVPVKVTLADGAKALPGFYHVFLRVHAADDTLRYGWAEVRKPGAPQFDRSEGGKVTYADGAMDFNLDQPLTVVYPDEASVLELEAAWTVFITLESATGRPVRIYQASDLPKFAGDEARAVVLVTREKGADPSVRVDGGKLVIAGGDEDEVLTACVDFVLRYWKTAKDAGARKVGLVQAPKAEAGGKTDLD